MKEKKNTEVKEVKQSKKEKDMEKELQKTKDELNDIKQMIKQMMDTKNENASVVNKEVIQEQEQMNDYVDIPANKYIKVISLTNHMLVLTTQPMGQGKPYIFNRYGESRNIIFSDLQDVVHNQERFAREGKFYIADKNVIRVLGLEIEYEKILDRKTIDNILNFDNETISSIFASASASQKEVIVSLLIGKIKSGENIDLNKVDVISKVFGKNIIELARPEIEIEE